MLFAFDNTDKISRGRRGEFLLVVTFQSVHTPQCISLNSALIVIEIDILWKPLCEFIHRELLCELHCNYTIILFPS